MFIIIENYRKMLSSFLRNDFAWGETSGWEETNVLDTLADTLDFSGEKTKDFFKHMIDAWNEKLNEHLWNNDNAWNEATEKINNFKKEIKTIGVLREAEKYKIVDSNKTNLLDFKKDMDEHLNSLITRPNYVEKTEDVKPVVEKIKQESKKIKPVSKKVKTPVEDIKAATGKTKPVAEKIQVVADVTEPVAEKTEEIPESLRLKRVKALVEIYRSDSKFSSSPETKKLFDTTVNIRRHTTPAEMDTFEAALMKVDSSLWKNPDTGLLFKKGDWTTDSIDWFKNGVTKVVNKVKDTASNTYNKVEGAVEGAEDSFSDYIGFDLIDDDLYTFEWSNWQTVTVEFDRMTGKVTLDTPWTDSVLDFTVGENMTKEEAKAKIDDYTKLYNDKLADGSIYEKTVDWVTKAYKATVEWIKDATNATVEWTKETYEQVKEWLAETFSDPDLGTFVWINGKTVTMEYDKESWKVSADTAIGDGIKDFDAGSIIEELKKGPLSKEKVTELFNAEKASYETQYNDKVMNNIIPAVQTSGEKEYYTIWQVADLRDEVNKDNNGEKIKGDRLDAKLIRRYDVNWVFEWIFVNIATWYGDKIWDGATDQKIKWALNKENINAAIAKANAQYQKLYAEKNK